MRIITPTPDHARHIGKRFAKVLGVPLTRGYTIAANVLGYKGWDELIQHCDWSEGFFTSLAAVPDRLCMPRAVLMRRQFQAFILASVAGADLTRAVEIIEQVKPSDGFDMPPSLFGDSARLPRRIDPRLELETYAQLSVDLFRLWQVAGWQPRIAKPLKEAALLLERFQLTEWPMNQFLYSLADTPFVGRSPTYLGDLHRAPKFLSAQAMADFEPTLPAIATTICNADIQGMEEATSRLALVIATAQKHVSAWRDKSAGHDGQAVRFDGIPPIEDEGVELLQQHVKLTKHQAFLLRYPEFDAAEARRLLDSIEGLDDKVRALKPLRFVATKLKRGLATYDRRIGVQEFERLPLNRSWDVWGIGAGTVVSLGTVTATSSMRAIASAPGFVAGRVIAVPAGCQVSPRASEAQNPMALQAEVRS